MKTLQKKEVENLQGFILSIVGIAVVLAVGLIVLGQLANQTTAGTAERNATTAIAAQLGTVPNWIGILITVALAFIVLGYFYNR
jgi:multisubunit Na+/H+ antiporter MnhB subunit